MLRVDLARQPSVNMLNWPRRFRVPKSLIQSQIPTVRVGSLADIGEPRRDVRFTLRSGRVDCAKGR